MASKKTASPKKADNKVKGSQVDLGDATDGSDGYLSETSQSESNMSPPVSSDGETVKNRGNRSPKKKQNGGSVNENISDGEIPSKLHYNTESSKECNGTNFNLMFWIVLGIVLLGIALVGLYYYDQQDSLPSSSQSSCHLLMTEVLDLIRNFNFSTSIQRNMKATYEEMINDQRPVVLMLVSDSNGPAISECLVKSQIKLYRDHFKHLEEPRKIVLSNSLSVIKTECETTGGDVSRCVSNKFVELFQNSLKNTGVLWLEGLEAFNSDPGLIVSLNSFADHQDAPFKQTLIFMTANVDRKPGSSVKSYFQKAWTQNSKNCAVGNISCMTSENFQALWTRIELLPLIYLMALKPRPKVIADELFERWLRKPGTLELLNAALNKIAKGETPLDSIGNGSCPPQSTDVPSLNNVSSSRSSTVGLSAPPKGSSSPAATNSPRRQVFTEQTNKVSSQSSCQPSNQTPVASTNGLISQQSSQQITNGRPQQNQQLQQQQQQQPTTIVNQKQPVISPSITPSVEKFNNSPNNFVQNSVILPPQQQHVPPGSARTNDKQVDMAKPPLAVSSSSSNGNSASNIPRFYFPLGRPVASDTLRQQTDRLVAAFEKLGNVATRVQVGEIAKDCLGLGRYWRVPLFLKAQSLAGVVDRVDYVTKDAFLNMWKRMTTQCFDQAARFIWLLSSTPPAMLPSSLLQNGQAATGQQRSGRPGTAPLLSSAAAPVPSSCLFALPQDFIPMMQDIVDNHPSLDFLRDAKEFHSRYMHTVIARIFYAINRSWSGRLVVAELRQSRFLEALARLDDEDVNRSTEYFSYEHFYVIYCKFWELDKDHDLLITRDELSTHNNHAISPRIIDRIFSGAVTKGRCLKEGKMSYNEFVWFLISEEDKKHPTSIEYWFRCMDLDGDGYLTSFEMEFFYDEQHQRLMQMSIEPLSLKDLICQLLDMVNPKIPGKITLSDLKACRLSDVFFNTFINIYKYIDYEQKDPFSNLRELEQLSESTAPVTDWERFAAQEYMALVAEETSNDGGTVGGNGNGVGSGTGSFNQSDDVDGSMARITGLGCSDDEF